MLSGEMTGEVLRPHGGRTAGVPKSAIRTLRAQGRGCSDEIKLLKHARSVIWHCNLERHAQRCTFACAE
jgi:hypothetical protein